jgi:hypothetical protein
MMIIIIITCGFWRIRKRQYRELNDPDRTAIGWSKHDTMLTNNIKCYVDNVNRELAYRPEMNMDVTASCIRRDIYRHWPQGEEGVNGLTTDIVQCG